jgi:hypothetical protein
MLVKVPAVYTVLAGLMIAVCVIISIKGLRVTTSSAMPGGGLCLER